MTRIAENQMTGNRARRLLVLGAAIALIVIALGLRSAAAASPPHPFPEFHNDVGLGGFCCAVIPGAGAAPGNVIVIQGPPFTPPAPPRHTADQHFTSETQNDVEIVRGPPSLR
jgi:hypothetical protein